MFYPHCYLMRGCKQTSQQTVFYDQAKSSSLNQTVQLIKWKFALFFLSIIVCLPPVWTSLLCQQKQTADKSNSHSGASSDCLNLYEIQTGFGSAGMIRVGSTGTEQINNLRKAASRFTDHLWVWRVEQLTLWSVFVRTSCVFVCRMSFRFLRLSVCGGVSLSERGRLRPHQRAVLLQDGLHRTELWAQWVSTHQTFSFTDVRI